jgi:hypothetical protein
MRLWRLLLGLFACGWIGAGAVSAQVLPVSATHPSGQPGTTVVSAFTVDLGSSYDLVAFNLFLDFDPGALTFLEGSTTLQASGQNPVGLIAALDAMALDTSGDFDYVVSQGAGQYSLSGLLWLGVAPVSGPVTVRATFQIDPGAIAGASPVVQFHGMSSQQWPLGDYSDDIFAAQSIVSVSAIPEPAHWLMLTLGLATVLLAGGTRVSRRSRRSR